LTSPPIYLFGSIEGTIPEKILKTPLRSAQNSVIPVSQFTFSKWD